MARVTYVKKAQQRYATVPVIDPETGQQKVTEVFRRNGERKLTKKGKPVVLRVTEADKSRPLPNHVCESCHLEIEVGTSYKWIAPKSGPYGGRKRYRHATCPSWRPSEVTSSNIKSIVYGAQESFSDTLGVLEEGDLDGLVDAVHTFGSDIREAAEAARESAQNIEDGFGHPTYQSEELTERADALESVADEAESWDGTEFEDEEPTEDDFTDEENPVEALAEAIEEWETARSDWWSDQVSEAEGLTETDE